MQLDALLAGLGGLALGALGAAMITRARFAAERRGLRDAAAALTSQAARAEADATAAANAEHAKAIARLRHDVRGLLSPALLIADKLSRHADAQVRSDAEAVIAGIEKAAEKLKAG